MSKSRKNNPQTEKVAIKAGTKFWYCLVNVLSVILPLIFFTIIPTFVKNLVIFYYDEEGKICFNGSNVFYLIITSLISLAIIIYNCYLSTRGYEVITRKKYDKLISSIDQISADADIFSQLLTSFDNLCKHKEFVIFNLIKQRKKGNIDYSVITEPANQLQEIFKVGMCETLRTFFEFDNPNNKIEVSVAYKYGSSDDWKWMESYEPNHRCLAQNLSTNPDTTFFELVNSKSNYVFHNSKLEASQNRHYLKNDANTPDGSIVGRRVYIGSYEEPYAEIIYFFTTTNVKLIQRDTVEEEHAAERKLGVKLEDYFFNKFDYRIKIEFELLYLKDR